MPCVGAAAGSRARGLQLLQLRCLRDGGMRVDNDDEHDGSNDVIIHLIVTMAGKRSKGL